VASRSRTAKSKASSQRRGAAQRKTASRRKAPASRSTNALTLLRNDHQEVTKLFEQYEKGKKRMNAARKGQLAKQITQMLSVHAQIEEEIFYPACRRQVRGAEELLAEAQVEHQSAKELIAKIEGQTPGEESFDAQVKVLGEYVKHHVKEEQNELFAKARKSSMDLSAIGEQLAQRKAELMQRA
jgi:hemerythrin-like domain-containing protein